MLLEAYNVDALAWNASSLSFDQHSKQLRGAGMMERPLRGSSKKADR